MIKISMKHISAGVKNTVCVKVDNLSHTDDNMTQQKHTVSPLTLTLPKRMTRFSNEPGHFNSEKLAYWQCINVSTMLVL